MGSGTDYGHANYMFLLGGQVKGGCVHDNGRDLRPTTYTKGEI
jgi:uncharacterized protein (DUF1501 family)